MDAIIDEKLTDVAQLIRNKIPTDRRPSLESVKEFIRKRAEELIKAS